MQSVPREVVRSLLDEGAQSGHVRIEGGPAVNSEATTGISDAVFDALPIGGLIHAPDRIIAANQAACELLGSPYPAALEGRPLTDVIHPDGHEAGEARRSLLFERDQDFAAVPVRMVTTLGAPFTLTVSAASFIHEETRYAVVAAGAADRLGDKMPRRQPRAAGPLRETALEAFPLPVIAVTQRRVAVANAAARALLGRPSDDLIGEEALELLHPDARDAMEERTESLRKFAGASIRIPLKSMTAEGRDLHLSSLASHIPYRDHGVFTFVVTDASL